MDIKDLDFFIKAAESGNLTHTSESLGYSPSAGSHIIKRLEEELGTPLFVRGPAGVTLTLEGKRLLPLARKVTDAAAALHRQASRLAANPPSILTVASITSVAAEWLPELIESFAGLRPDTSVRVIEGDYDEVAEWLRRGRAELGFLSSSCTGDLEAWPLESDPLMVILPADHPLAALDQVPAARLADEHFIVPAEGLDHEIGDIIPDRAMVSRLRSEAGRSSDYSALLLVKQKRGFTIMPELLLRGALLSGIAARPLAGGFSRTICIACLSREKLTPEGRAFLKYVLEQKELQASIFSR